MTNDLISRQAAIEALESIGSLDTDADREYARGIFNALPSAQPETHDKHTETHACDTISRQAAIEALGEEPEVWTDSDAEIAERNQWRMDVAAIKAVPSAQPERLTDDDFETIRIHLNACKEKLCNQRRWEEAEEYRRIIDRFMAFASVYPERKRGKWILVSDGYTDCVKCDKCGEVLDVEKNFCPNCGADMRGERDE